MALHRKNQLNVPSLNAIVNLAYLKTGNKRYYLRNTYMGPLCHFNLRKLFYVVSSATLTTTHLRTCSVITTSPWLTPMQHFD